MEKASSQTRSVRFGSFELDLRAGELREQGVKIKLQEQPFQILAVLLENPGQVVTREELRSRLWPSDTFVDFDHSLNKAINKLREALGDSAENPRFVETLPRRGYRFIGQLSNRAVSLPAQSFEEAAEKSPPTATPKKRQHLVLGLTATACAAAIALLLGVNVAGLRDRVTGRAHGPTIQSLAVLPLANLSNDPSQEYFADGMTDALITELSQIASIKVISRTSVMPYRGTDKPLSQIARELGVDGIVEGTVQRSGDQMRITAQLIYAPGDRHVWAKSYERGSQNVLALEQDVAQAIAEEIRATLTPREKARLARIRPISFSSLQAYLQGRYHWEQADGMAYQKDLFLSQLKELATAREFFEQAIREDPGYAQAYVGLAKTWRDRPVAENGPEKADALLRKALVLDPDLAEAHETLATLDVLRQWRWSEAEREYRRAIELNPNYAEAHARFAEYLDMMLRFDEGMKEFVRTQELDPGHSFQPNPFYRRRQYDRAIQLDQNEVKRHAFGFWSHVDLAFDYDGAGRHDEAAQQWEEVMRMLGYTDIADAMHRGLARSGYKGAIRALTAGLEAEDARGASPPAFFPAIMYGLLGEKDRAFAWLERGYRERDAAYSALNVDPCWDPLRSDPRFRDLLRRMNFPS